MCGRFALTSSAAVVAAMFEASAVGDFAPRYNIAPSQPIVVVREASSKAAREIAHMRWGMTARTRETDHRSPSLLSNARAETIADKATFRAAFRRRRCLVPADAFYEWHGTGRGAQPYRLRAPDGELLALAAIWETWMGPNGEEVDTACIITTEANADTVSIHPRLPAIIAPAHFARWLHTPELDWASVTDLLAPTTRPLECVAITDAVNRVANEGPQVQDPAPAPVQGSLF